jgi:hypothetical protein
VSIELIIVVCLGCFALFCVLRSTQNVNCALLSVLCSAQNGYKVLLSVFSSSQSICSVKNVNSAFSVCFAQLRLLGFSQSIKLC